MAEAEPLTDSYPTTRLTPFPYRGPNADHMDNACTRYRITGADVSLVNTWRRIMIAETPIMAFSKVLFLANTSELPDEFLAHRIGLIPLRVVPPHTVDEFSFPHVCDCVSRGAEPGATDVELCPRCDVLFELNVQVPVDSDSVRVVTSDDLVFSSLHDEADAGGVAGGPVVETVQYVLRPAAREPSVAAIPIVKLNPGQSLVLMAIASKGIGKLHAKFNPVCTAHFQYVPNVKVDERAVARLELTPACMQAISTACPTKVFEDVDTKTPGAARLQVAKGGSERCIFCNECLIEAERLRAPGVVSVTRLRSELEGPPGQHVLDLYVETTGSLTPHEAAVSSVRQLREKLKVLHDRLVTEAIHPSTTGGAVGLIGRGVAPNSVVDM
eukprot:TRINITY_DN22827_c0_g1_i1.p1 TRINITY_DN22827_c0_g1~~TRINITY_DN22827_c0_g1_i1.p1  ORF type:complete len:384 (+),score=64.38 TRINITY_DN22827_c0_g1_i1:111-1262(+)